MMLDRGVEQLLIKFSDFQSVKDIDKWFDETIPLVYDIFYWKSAQAKSFVRLFHESDYGNDCDGQKKLRSKIELQIRVLKLQLQREISKEMDKNKDLIQNENLNLRSNPFRSIKFFSGIYLMEISKTPIGTKVYHFLYFEQIHDDESPDIFYYIREGCILGNNETSLRNVDATKYDLHYLRYNISAENKIVWTNHYKNTFTINDVNNKLLVITKVTPYSTTELKYAYYPFPDYYDEADDDLPF